MPKEMTDWAFRSALADPAPSPVFRRNCEGSEQFWHFVPFTGRGGP